MAFQCDDVQDGEDHAGRNAHSDCPPPLPSAQLVGFEIHPCLRSSPAISARIVPLDEDGTWSKSRFKRGPDEIFTDEARHRRACSARGVPGRYDPLLRADRADAKAGAYRG